MQNSIRAALLLSLSLPLLGVAHESDPLVSKVREVTEKYLDINAALNNKSEGWVVGTPCVSGPDFGAMGVHLVAPSRLDGIVDVSKPEALIYEPMEDGAMRLVGVEYIVIADAWASLHSSGTPALEGNLMNFVPAPNRFGLPAFYELHVWAWEHNPKGSFADWNTQVTCEHQALP
jgi:hypothetical protein